MSEQERFKDGWHLDKRFPLALLFGLACQAALFGVWVGSFKTQTEERLTQIERRLEGFSERSQTLASEVNAQGRTQAVILSRLDETNRNIDRVREQLSETIDILREIPRGTSRTSD